MVVDEPEPLRLVGAHRQPRLGDFLSGGNARRRPYEEDYDLLALLDSEDPAAQTFVERVVVLMNAHIAQRGVITQYPRGNAWAGS